MIFKQLWAFIILFSLQISPMNYSTSEEHNNLFTFVPEDLLPVIGSHFNCVTMCNWKQTCKKFNAICDYKHISATNISFDNYAVCTQGLMYFADTDNKNNFIALMNNNFDKRSSDIKKLGWGENPSLEDQINAYKGIQGPQPLHLDSSTDHYETFTRLTNINPNIRDTNGESPLMIACTEDRVIMAKRLLGNPRTNPNIKSSQGIPLLLYVYLNNPVSRAKIIKYLLNNAKTNPNIQDDNGDSLLLKASKTGNIDTVILLLNNKKTNLNLRDKDGYTALDLACGRRNTKMTQLLTAKNARHSWKYYIHNVDWERYVIYSIPINIGLAYLFLFYYIYYK